MPLPRERDRLPWLEAAKWSRVTRDRRRHLKDMTTEEKPKSKNIACGDIVPGCTFTATAATEEELIAQVAAHAAHDHGVTDITPELAAQVKAAIRTR